MSERIQAWLVFLVLSGIVTGAFYSGKHAGRAEQKKIDEAVYLDSFKKGREYGEQHPVVKEVPGDEAHIIRGMAFEGDCRIIPPTGEAKIQHYENNTFTFQPGPCFIGDTTMKINWHNKWDNIPWYQAAPPKPQKGSKRHRVSMECEGCGDDMGVTVLPGMGWTFKKPIAQPEKEPAPKWSRVIKIGPGKTCQMNGGEWFYARADGMCYAEDAPGAAPQPAEKPQKEKP